MAQPNPMQEGMDFYQRIVDEAIEEKGKTSTGRIQSVGNIDLMREMIRESPKAAQVAIQLMHRASDDSRAEAQAIGRLHGLWLMTAYLLEYGKMSTSSLMLKQFALNPRFERAWNNKGATLRVLQRYEEALACCDRALTINPNTEKAWFNKALTLGEGLGKWNDAIICFDRALEIDPHFERAWYNKGAACGRLGENEKALASFDRALELNPGDADAWFNKAVALRELGRHEEALNCIDRALELNPRDEETWLNKGGVLLLLRRVHEALRCFQQAQQLGHPQALRAIAMARRMIGM